MGVKFSVIMPVYNAAAYLSKTLQKVARLDQSAFNIYLINDGSTDRSGEILSDYCKFRNNAHFIDKKHGGVSSARNAGIDAADGEYILFLDADDSFLPSVFETLDEVIKDNSPDIIIFGAKIINYNPKFTLDDICPRNIVYKRFESSALFEEVGSRPYVWNCAYKVQFIKSKGIRFDEDISLGEDQLFQFTSFPQADVIQFISDKLYCYNYLERESVIKEYIQDVFYRVNRHIKLVGKIIAVIKRMGLFSLAQSPFYLWIYDFLHADMFLLSRKQFKVSSKILRRVLRQNSIHIFGMHIPLKKKLSYASLCYPFARKLRKIIQ